MAVSMIYLELAETNHDALVPFQIDGVALVPGLNQQDPIRPTAEGHRKVAETAWVDLLPQL